MAFPVYARISVEGFDIDRGDATQRTPMADGMIKQLKTKSRVLVQRNVTILLDSLADYNSFITWFQTTINFGADWFTWTDPVDGVAKNARFVSKLGKEGPRAGVTSKWQIQAVIETWNT